MDAITGTRSPFKWPVSATARIAASSDRVWRAISMPGNLELCHPFCERNPVTAWPGPDSRDEVHYLNGLVFERRFVGWLEGVGYDLEIVTRRGEVSPVSWRIESVTSDISTLTITVEPYVLQHLPVAIRWVPHLVRVRPLLKSYLSSVVAGFEWYVTRGQPVPRNQFGTHPWFSESRS